MRVYFRAGIFIAGIVVMSLFSQMSYASTPGKFAFIDFEKVFNDYYRTQEENAKLQNEKTQKEEEGQLIVDEINKLKEEAELLSDEAQKTKNNQIRQKIAELKTFEKEARALLVEKRNTLWKDIFADIKSFVAELAKKEGYTAVFDEKALLFFDPKYDITETVLQELNKSKQQPQQQAPAPQQQQK